MSKGGCYSNISQGCAKNTLTMLTTPRVDAARPTDKCSFWTQPLLLRQMAPTAVEKPFPLVRGLCQHSYEATVVPAVSIMWAFSKALRSSEQRQTARSGREVNTISAI